MLEETIVNLFPRDPLTPRLAGPPLPQGGEGREFKSPGLDRILDSDRGLDFFRRHHLDGIPRAAIKKAAVRAFAGTLLAADAERGVHLNPAERRMVLIGNPVHAVGDGAIRNTGGGARTSCATLRDDSEFLGALLAWGFNADGFGLALDDFPNGNVILSQVGPPRPECKHILPKRGGDVKKSGQWTAVGN